MRNKSKRANHSFTLFVSLFHFLFITAVRIVRKVPELIEDFIPSVLKLLLNDKKHSVRLTAITLIIEMVRLNRKLALKKFRKITPVLVRLLKDLLLSGFVPEYDVVGITDPFLQVKILELLRLLGEKNQVRLRSACYDVTHTIFRPYHVTSRP
jgi:hypothetical protein